MTSPHHQRICTWLQRPSINWGMLALGPNSHSWRVKLTLQIYFFSFLFCESEWWVKSKSLWEQLIYFLFDFPATLGLSLVSPISSSFTLTEEFFIYVQATSGSPDSFFGQWGMTIILKGPRHETGGSSLLFSNFPSRFFSPWSVLCISLLCTYTYTRTVHSSLNDRP